LRQYIIKGFTTTSTSLLAVSFSLATLVVARLFSILRLPEHSEVTLDQLMLSGRPPIRRFWPQQVVHVSCKNWLRGVKLPEEVVEGLLLHTGREWVVVVDNFVQRNVLDLNANNFAILDMLLVVLEPHPLGQSI
jgi:hypothetical protein